MQLTLLGTGNVATALGTAFFESGHQIIQVYARKFNAAENLAAQFNAESTDNLEKLKEGSDAYLFCISDDAIEEVTNQILLREILVVHTSGAMPISILQKEFEQSGVLYPLQTISSNRKLNFKEVPLCIEGSNKQAEEKVKDLAKSISNNIHFVNSQQRLFLHLAAVFANNFTNSLYINAANLLETHNLSFRLLHPLLIETAMKAIDLDPRKAQTGPAARNDKAAINKHLNLLESHPGLKEIYEVLSGQIQQQQKD